MKEHNRWILYAKLNFGFFLVFASFLFLITIVIADNRFEQEVGFYVFLGILWLIVLINGTSWNIIIKLKKNNKPVPFMLKSLISMFMVSIILVLFFSNYQGYGSDVNANAFAYDEETSKDN